MRRLVGFVAILRLPVNESELVALLQVRDQNDSWGGACQVTAHGGVEDGESFFEALVRETEEEVCKTMADHLRGNERDLILLENVDTSDKQIRTYAILLSNFDWLIRDINMERFCLVTPDYRLRDVYEFCSEKTEKVPQGVKAMFPDKIVVVRDAFKYFSE